MVKRPGARGGFRRSRAPVHLSDVPDAVCEIAGVCARRFGRSLFEVREGDPRKRRYVDYKWKAEYWKSERIPMIKFYDITGPAHLPASWMLIERVEP
jgi:hypothetical protein